MIFEPWDTRRVRQMTYNTYSSPLCTYEIFCWSAVSNNYCPSFKAKHFKLAFHWPAIIMNERAANVQKILFNNYVSTCIKTAQHSVKILKCMLRKSSVFCLKKCCLCVIVTGHSGGGRHNNISLILPGTTWRCC